MMRRSKPHRRVHQRGNAFEILAEHCLDGSSNEKRASDGDDKAVAPGPAVFGSGGRRGSAPNVMQSLPLDPASERVPQPDEHTRRKASVPPSTAATLLDASVELDRCALRLDGLEVYAIVGALQAGTSMQMIQVTVATADLNPW